MRRMAICLSLFLLLPESVYAGGIRATTGNFVGAGKARIEAVRSACMPAIKTYCRSSMGNPSAVKACLHQNSDRLSDRCRAVAM